MSAAPLSDVYAPRQWPPGTRPTLPGSPSSPEHPARLRLAYLATGILVSLTGGLGNALVTVNLASLQGALGAYAVEMQWLPTAYAMTMVSMNLLLVKFRQQYGLQLFTELALGLYALATALHLLVDTWAAAVAVRALNGVAGAAMTVLGLYYVLQACTPSWRLRGLVIGIGLPQLAMPLARLLSPRLLEMGSWRSVSQFELGLAMVSLGAVILLKLPHGDRMRAFSRLDFVTFILFAPGAALVCAVLGLGKAVWWFDAAWLGTCLALAIPLLAAAVAVESRRRTPLLNIQWLTRGRMAVLMGAALLIRIVLAEAGGAVGFLQAMGLVNEQMSALWLVAAAGSGVGLAASALALRPERITALLMAALACVAMGAVLDADATNLVRPDEMLVSQFLLAFGGTLFFGPAFVGGFGAVLADPRNLPSFAVVFTMTQTIGSLAGSALVSTFQTLRQKFHSNQLNDHLSTLDPLVVERLRSGADALAGSLADPSQRGAYGAVRLGAAASREAAVLAYNDVFMLIAALALASLAWLAAVHVRTVLASGRAGSRQ